MRCAAGQQSGESDAREDACERDGVGERALLRRRPLQSAHDGTHRWRRHCNGRAGGARANYRCVRLMHRKHWF